MMISTTVDRSLRVNSAGMRGPARIGYVNMKTVEIRISGRVQRVGMRNCVRHIAGTLSIRGDVMNLPDGTVRIRATGDSITLDKFISMLYGCPRALIRDVEVMDIPYTPFLDFAVVRAEEKAD